MDNSSNSTNRQGDAPEMDGRISIDVHILLAVLATMIMVVVVQMVSHAQDNEKLKNVASGVLIIILMCCIAISWWRSFTANSGAQKRSVSLSSALGSLLSGLFSVAFADIDPQTILAAVIAMCFVIAALCVIGIVVLLFQREKIEQPSKQVRNPVRPASMQSVDDYSNGLPSRVPGGGPTPINLQHQQPPAYPSQLNRPPTHFHLQPTTPPPNPFLPPI